MDYAKLDAPLAQAVDADVDQGTRVLPVIIRLTRPPTDPERDVLRGYGAEPPEGDRTVVTATLSAADVDALSDHPWVLALTLSGQRRPLGPTD